MSRALLAILVISPMVALLAAAEEPTADGLNFFETKIRPVLVERCYKCHSAEALWGMFLFPFAFLIQNRKYD